jgi:hypothetical protein
MAHSRCAHFIAVVCLKAPSMFGQKMQPCYSQQGTGKVKEESYRKLTNRGAAPHQLTPSAEPLPFRYKWHAITFLMYGQIASIAEYYCIGVLAVAVIANGALRVLLFTGRFTINCGCATRPWSMRLRWLRIWFRDACHLSVLHSTWIDFNLDSRFSRACHSFSICVMVTSKIAGLMPSTPSSFR